MSDLTYSRILALAMLDALQRKDIYAYQAIACNPHTPASSIAAACILSDRIKR